MTRPHRPPQLSVPLRRLLILLLPLGLVVIMWQAAQVAREQALQTLVREAENELRLSASGLEGHLTRHHYLPQLLASRDEVRRFLASQEQQNPMPLNLLLDQFRATADVSDIYLLDANADTLAASNWHRPNTFIGQNYAFRSYYQDAIEGGRGRFYGLGVQSLERGYYFSAPVWLDDIVAGSSPSGVMVVKVLLDTVEESWAAQDAVLLVTDKDDIVFMASHPELRMTAMQQLSEQERQALLTTRRYADEPLSPAGIEVMEARPDGSRLIQFNQGPLANEGYLTLARPMEAYGWDMHILKPFDGIYRAQWLSAAMAGGLYGVIVLASGIGWQRLRLRRERELFAERERQTLARARDELERNVALRTRDLVETNRLLSEEIEERRRAEENLRRTQDELVQAAKLAMLGQLAAGINHELNQPLTAIRAYAENARAFLERQRLSAVDANLAQVVELTERMAEISAQLRQFSRKSDSSLTTVSVQACFAYALRLYQSRMHNVEVVQDWDTEAWVHADLVRLEQVLVNLIGNALQAMAEAPISRLTLSTTLEAEYIRISVSDTGPGIPATHLAHIFEPFFTTKSPGTGLGLGLSISARIIQDLGGRIEARNLSDSGACFTLILPRAESPESSPYPSEERQTHA